MLINDIILSENYTGELIDAVRRLLVQMMSSDIGSMPTSKFKHSLAQQGFVVSTEELIAAVDSSGFASSVDREQIVPKSELPADLGQEEEPTVDVGALAGDQALADINSELPQ
jgi:hypothetical protein